MEMKNTLWKTKVKLSLTMKPYLIRKFLSDLILNPKSPWLGYSPNDIVDGQKVTEIKNFLSNSKI